MTNAQERAIKQIKIALENYMKGVINYTLTEFEVEDGEYSTSITFKLEEMDIKNEGLRLMIAQRGTIFIGKRGGMYYYDMKNGKRHHTTQLVDTMYDYMTW